MLKRLKTFLAFVGALSLLFMGVMAFRIIDGGSSPDEFPGPNVPRAQPDTSGSSTLDNVTLRGRLFVAMPPRFPGVSERGPDGQPAGFDVEIARLVAEGLGLDRDAVEFKPLADSMITGSLTSGDVDLAFGALPMAGQQGTGVELVGPYLDTSVGLAVLADDSTTTLATLGANPVCAVAGTTDSQTLLPLAPAAQVTEEADLARCADRLQSGAVTAIVADDGLLRGLASTAQGQYRILDVELAEQGLGIGLRPGDAVLRDAVNGALLTAIANGGWQDAYDATLARSGVPAGPPTLR